MDNIQGSYIKNENGEIVSPIVSPETIIFNKDSNKLNYPVPPTYTEYENIKRRKFRFLI